jgi:hypothetical protein
LVKVRVNTDTAFHQKNSPAQLTGHTQCPESEMSFLRQVVPAAKLN